MQFNECYNSLLSEFQSPFAFPSKLMEKLKKHYIDAHTKKKRKKIEIRNHLRVLQTKDKYILTGMI